MLCIRHEYGWYFVCVTQSKPLHVFAHTLSINCTIIVDVPHIFHFDVDLISDPGQGHKKVFLHTLYKMGGTLCIWLSSNRFTYLHTLGANQLYNHCRCATYLSFWPWPNFRSRTRSQKRFFCILYIRGVVLVWATRALHICTDLVPINCTFIVDVQHIFYFDFDLFSDPGQGHKNFFCCMLYLNRNEWQLCHFLHVNYMPIIISLIF